MALESASYIAGLNTANPSSTDTVSQADDHLRLIKSVLKNTFPNLDQPVTASPATLNTPVPSGFIGLWYGSVASIPSGWVLCNGSNSTPDLRDRFVIGAGSTYSVNGTGGSATQSLTTGNIPAHTHSVSGNTGGQSATHTHAITIADPGHSHSLNNFVATFPSGGGGAVNYTANGYGGAYNSGSSTTGISASAGNASADHTHTFSAVSTSVGSGTAFSILPPYYALAYIMKT